MSLAFTGNKDENLTWVRLEAIDGVKLVVVKVSHEAAKDYGLERAQAAAQRKYAQMPSSPVIIVSSDCI